MLTSHWRLVLRSCTAKSRWGKYQMKPIKTVSRQASRQDGSLCYETLAGADHGISSSSRSSPPNPKLNPPPPDSVSSFEPTASSHRRFLLEFLRSISSNASSSRPDSFSRSRSTKSSYGLSMSLLNPVTWSGLSFKNERTCDKCFFELVTKFCVSAIPASRLTTRCLWHFSMSA